MKRRVLSHVDPEARVDALKHMRLALLEMERMASVIGDDDLAQHLAVCEQLALASSLD